METHIVIPPADIPSPRTQLARFRLARLSESVHLVSGHGQKFRDAVDAAIEGDDKRGGPRELTRAFARSYLALRAAIEASRVGKVMSNEALGALDGIMAVLKREYKGAVDGLTSDVLRLNGASDSRRYFTQFCVLASNRIDRLEAFWQATYEHVPRARVPQMKH